MNENNKDNMEIKIMEAFTSIKSDREIGMPNVEDELSKLLGKKNKQTKSHWQKVAASVAAIVTVCSIAVAAIISHRTIVPDERKPEVTESAVSTKLDDANATPVNEVLSKPRVVAFDNAELSEILDSISYIYKVEVVFKSDDARHLHLHFQFYTDDKLNEVVQNLNIFDKINIKEKDGKLEIK